MRARRPAGSAARSRRAAGRFRPAGAWVAGTRTRGARAAGAHGAGRTAGAFRFARIASFARLVRPGRALPPARSVRGMLLTPWLSAAAGIVVAAGLALNVPHAVLTYSPTYPGTHCRLPGCGSAGPRQRHGGLAATSPGIKLQHARHRGARQSAGTGVRPATTPAVTPTKAPGTPAHRHGAPVDVWYQTMQRWPAGFTALITIISRAHLDGWRLAFRYPGVHIDSVTGAKWVARGDGDGGVASAVPWPWGRPAGKQIRILIIANGTPGRPAACRFDGARCAFGAATGNSGRAPGRSGWAHARLGWAHARPGWAPGRSGWAHARSGWAHARSG